MLTGIVAGVAAGALWGLVFVAPRMVTGFSSVDLAAGRFVAYGAVAAAVCLWTRRPLATASQALAAVGLSLLGFTGYYLLLVLAIRDAGTEVPTLIIGTIPIWVMLLGKPGHLRWGALAPGIVLTAAGLAVMTLSPHAADAGGHGANFVRGLLFALASLACWTAF
ncbi:MAG TPA: EamA family transporter, partial [Ramlibacter sp.]